MRTIKTRQAYLKTDFKTRTKDDKKFIEGYFIKFNEPTELWKGVWEEVAPESVLKSLEENDIKVLFNHDTGVVLGRTGNGTVHIRYEPEGVFARVEINPADMQAMDVYARVERGDINACSFGFRVIEEDYENLEDGTHKYTLREIDLVELSVVTFPAYPTTSVQARKKEFETMQLEKKRYELKERINKCLDK